jgi:hypothetical protein
MQKQLSTILSLFVVWFSLLSFNNLYALGEGDRINMAVSPIRDEFNAPAWTAIQRQVTFYNNADVPYSVYITTEDCQPGTNYGTPICQPAGGSGVDLIHSSTWITTNESGLFTIAPNSNRVITYTVNVPSNAPPGGHYGALFFNNPDMTVSGNAVKMNRRIGMLYLMTVPGDIVVDTDFWDILVDAGPGGWAGSVGPTSLMTLFSAPRQFFDESMKRFMMYFTDPEESEKLLNEINPLWEKPTLRDDDFLVTLRIPVENAGNTHVTPTGKIYLYEGDTRLEHIGRQSIVDENGVYLGEKIVDFLPINDEWWNVLPGTDRIFNIDWAWFASDDIDPVTGKHIVRFESPGSYYSRIAWSAGQFLFPWEKLAIRTMNKSLRASVEINYKNPLTQLNEVTTLEIPVPVSYTYVAKTWNWSLMLLILLVTLLILTVRRRNHKIHDLEDETHHLEDEIYVLERARASMESKKKVAKTPAKKSVKTVKVEEPPAVAVVPAKKKPLAKAKTPATETVTPKPKSTPKKKPSQDIQKQ